MKALPSILVCMQILGCSGKQFKPIPSPGERAAAAKKAVAELQATRFEEAGKEAQTVLTADPGNPQASVIAAVTHYKKTMHNFVLDMQTNLMGMMRTRAVNHRYLRWSLEQTDQELAKVEGHLAAAAEDPSFTMRLCLACWRYDWNHDGRVDERDELLFQIELDAEGKPIPEGDPRRKPFFRFDSGDVFWARAMISFQRALFHLLLAYRMPEFHEFENIEKTSVLTIKMKDKTHVHRARDLFLAGLAHADRARREYLAEKDDEGEWLPNPSQKNHPLPLPVDETLYKTWEGALADLRRLIEGEEGISVVEVAQLGDHQWKDPPRGYINVARLLEEPGDITLNVANLERLDHDKTKEDVERVLRDVFGDKYVMKMKPTPLISRFVRMKKEIKRGEESLERKLRYLFWLN